MRYRYDRSTVESDREGQQVTLSRPPAAVSYARATRFVLSSVAALFLVSCVETPTDLKPNADVRAAATAPALATFRLRAEEAAFAELEDVSPSSAGFFFDTAGDVVLLVVSPTEDELAAARMYTLLSERAIKSGRTHQPRVVVRRAQFSFRNLAHWRDLVHDNVLGVIRGVTYLDLTEHLNRITIGLSKEAFLTLRFELPPLLEKLGVDTAAVRYVSMEPPSSTSSRTIERAFRRAPGRNLADGVRWDSLVGGIEIEYTLGGGGYKSCSLGIVADRGNQRGVVTDAHCSTTKWGTDNGPLYQPSGHQYQIATETYDPQGWSCWLVLTCRNSDASFYHLSTDNAYRGLIARTTYSAGPGVYSMGSLEVDTARPYFIVTSVDHNDSYTGQYVHKMGRTTGWTWGQITNTCGDYTNWPNITECTYKTDMKVDFGDSGAPVFTIFGDGYNQSSDLVELVGLVTAKDADNQSSGIVSKWGRILMDLGSMDATRQPTLSSSTLSGSMTFTSPNLNWTSVAGATRYELYKVSSTDNIPVLVANTTSSSFADGSVNALSYAGGSEPGGSGIKVRYFVYAFTGHTEISSKSNEVWYNGASGTFNVTILGPSVVGPNNYDCSSWTAQVTGAATIVSYAWSGFFSGSDSFVQGTIPQTGADFQVLVVDSQNRQGGYIIHVSYDPNNHDYCQ